MTTRFTLFLGVLVPLMLGGCSSEKVRSPRIALSAALRGEMKDEMRDYYATPREGGLEVVGATRDPAVLQTAQSRVVRWGFSEDGRWVVVESAGPGPAVLELFDLQTGTAVQRILKSSVQNGQPVWAALFAESQAGTGAASSASAPLPITS